MYSTPSRKRSRSAYTPSPFPKRHKKARIARSLGAKVNKILSQQERKWFDVSASQALAVNTPVVIGLANVTQGDDSTNRDGRKISIVSSQIRAVMRPTGADKFRVIVLIDKQSNGLTPVAGDILTAPSNVLSPLTMDFKERFRVIYDNFNTLGKGDFPADAIANSTNIYPMQYFYRCPDDLAQVEYGGVGNIPTSGAVWLLALSESVGNLEYYHRLRFTDS